jgi:hypothetical protein
MLERAATVDTAIVCVRGVVCGISDMKVAGWMAFGMGAVSKCGSMAGGLSRQLL